MPQLASVGHGVWVGNHNACDIFRKQFSNEPRLSPKVIHVWHPTQPGHCSNMVGHPSMESSDNLVIAYREGDLFTEKQLQSVYDFAFVSSQICPPLLVHCAAGMGRSPTLALVCKVARECNIFQAMGEVAKGMWTDYEIKAAPQFLTHPLRSVFEWFGDKIYDDPGVY